MKKSLISIAAGSFLAAISASGTLLITEIQSNQNFASGEDFFEITNFGNSAVDLTGWTYDDSSNNPAVGFNFGELSIAAGESIVFVEDLTAEAFRTWWGIPDTVQVVTYSGSGLGLGQDDAVNIFDADDNLVLSLSYAAGGFNQTGGTPSLGGHAGLSAGGTQVYQSLVWDGVSDPTSPEYTFAVAGTLGAFQAASGLDVGSPGVVPEPGSFGALVGLLALGLGLSRRRARA
ncbi:MAG: lamin tail domain-containing protein [Puniceicoccaceae bacterium]